MRLISGFPAKKTSHSQEPFAFAYRVIPRTMLRQYSCSTYETMTATRGMHPVFRKLRIMSKDYALFPPSR